ncbi:MAG: hypothetical protein WED15_09325 [Akkermansiaceae bacterium]
MQLRQLILLASGTFCAHAGEVSSLAAPIVPAAGRADWEFTLGLYSPMMGLKGDVGVAGRSAAIDIPFKDVLEDLDGGFMAAMELRRGPWSLTGDFIWLKLSDSYDLSPTASVVFKQEEILASLALGYEIYGNEQTRIEVLAGGALTDQDAELQFNTGNTRVAVSGDQTWMDPFLGLRLRHRVSERWTLFARGDYGGFGVSSDEYWQALAGLSFRINDRASLALAYRAISVDYEQGGFTYDALSSGPNLGVLIRF